MIELMPSLTPAPGFYTALLNDFVLEDKHRHCLDSYYILHWRLSYVQRKFDKINLTLEHADVTYIPVFKLNLGHLTHEDMQVKLSFRKTKSELNIPNYVLIKVA